MVLLAWPCTGAGRTLLDVETRRRWAVWGLVLVGCNVALVAMLATAGLPSGLAILVLMVVLPFGVSTATAILSQGWGSFVGMLRGR